MIANFKRVAWCAFRVIAAWFALSLPVHAHDSEPINTNFAAPFSRGAGNVQVKLQVFRGLGSYELIPLEFEYGFARRQQFSVGVALAKAEAGSKTYFRTGNLELAYRLLLAGDNQRKFALSINPALELPTGDKRVAERSWTAGGTVNLDTHLAAKWWTHTNIGYFTQIARIEDREKLIVYNNAVMYEAGLRFRPLLEVLGETNVVDHTTRVAIAPEVIYAPNHRWEVKAALPLGVTDKTPGVGVQLAVTWKFGERGRQ